MNRKRNIIHVGRAYKGKDGLWRYSLKVRATGEKISDDQGWPTRTEANLRRPHLVMLLDRQAGEVRQRRAHYVALLDRAGECRAALVPTLDHVAYVITCEGLTMCISRQGTWEQCEPWDAPLFERDHAMRLAPEAGMQPCDAVHVLDAIDRRVAVIQAEVAAIDARDKPPASPLEGLLQPWWMAPVLAHAAHPLVAFTGLPCHCCLHELGLLLRIA